MRPYTGMRDIIWRGIFYLFLTHGMVKKNTDRFLYLKLLKGKYPTCEGRDVTPCRLLYRYQVFGENLYFYLQDRKVKIEAEGFTKKSIYRYQAVYTALQTRKQ